MALGSDKLKSNNSKREYKGKGLVGEAGFKSDVYASLDDIFHDESKEIVVSLRNKYFGVSLKAFLEDMNFTFKESDQDLSIVLISLEDGAFKFIDNMEDKVTETLPYDWDSLCSTVRDYVSENPIVKKVKKKVEHKEDNWNTPMDEQPSTESGDAIDNIKDGIKKIGDMVRNKQDQWNSSNENTSDPQSNKVIDNIKDGIRKIQEKYGMSSEGATSMAKSKIKRMVHGENETVYTSKGNPDVQLKSGVYSNIEDLMNINGWDEQFKKDFGTTVRGYMSNESETDNIEKRLLREIGFEYILDIIEISENKYWNKRVIEVKFQDQDTTEMPDIDESEFSDNSQVICELMSESPMVLVGLGSDCDLKGFDPVDSVYVDDGHSTINIDLNGNLIEGFEIYQELSIFTLDQFKDLYKNNLDVMEVHKNLPIIQIDDLVGKIKISCREENGNFVKGFKYSKYSHNHTSEDDCNHIRHDYDEDGYSNITIHTTNDNGNSLKTIKEFMNMIVETSDVVNFDITKNSERRKVVDTFEEEKGIYILSSCITNGCKVRETIQINDDHESISVMNGLDELEMDTAGFVQIVTKKQLKKYINTLSDSDDLDFMEEVIYVPNMKGDLKISVRDQKGREFFDYNLDDYIIEQFEEIHCESNNFVSVSIIVPSGVKLELTDTETVFNKFSK